MMTGRTRVVTTVVISTALFASSGGAARGAAGPQTPSGSCECDPDVLDDLDARIQERFRTVDNRRFGYARMATVGSIPHTFDAESVREAASVVSLERARLRVVMYLAGRGVLRAKDGLNVDVAVMRPLIRGPVVVAPHPLVRGSAAFSSGFPAPADLLPESQRALRAFADGVRSTEFEKSGWHFVVKPVRASDQRCLTCHHDMSGAGPIRIGDPLGAVLYGHQSVR